MALLIRKHFHTGHAVGYLTNQTKGAMFTAADCVEIVTPWKDKYEGTSGIQNAKHSFHCALKMGGASFSLRVLVCCAL